MSFGTLTDPITFLPLAAQSSVPDALLISALIIAFGVASKVVADRYSVPSVVFLLILGIVFGPEGLGLINPNIFGDALSTIVAISVAIIVFEGGFHLTIPKIRKAPKSTLKLVTIGSAITLVGMGIIIRYLLNLPWDIAFLISALLVATGPTVITPVMSQVNVRDGVRGILESEGIINDVLAAILAVVMFEVVILGNATTQNFIQAFVSRLGVGVLIGLITAGIVWYVISITGDSSQNSRLLVLGSAVLSFAVAESVISESGIATVAVAGVILGNMDIPYKEEVSEFKGDITIVVLSVVFIILASLLEFEDIIALGLAGVGVVLLMMILIRPLGVLISTMGSRFTLGERLFISGVGPRGIVPASVATLFAIQLRAEPTVSPEHADMVVSVVFLIIIVTVVLQAGGAPFMADKLDIIPMNIMIVGGGRIGRDLAERLEKRGENVVIVEKAENKLEDLRAEGFTVVAGNGTEGDTLREAGIERTKIFVAATGDDDQNILAAQTARTKFNIEKVIARVNNIENLQSFEDLGVETVSPARATSMAIDNMIERPDLFSWMDELGEEGDVIEVNVTSDKAVGKSLQELGIPDNCTIALIRRDGERLIPRSNTKLR
ncbi:MAG: cation:proton antiporter [Halobacteria archaeon]|nr:cation:proton antiporter [Halobacteria archaeon]